MKIGILYGNLHGAAFLFMLSGRGADGIRQTVENFLGFCDITDIRAQGGGSSDGFHFMLGMGSHLRRIDSVGQPVQLRSSLAKFLPQKLLREACKLSDSFDPQSIQLFRRLRPHPVHGSHRQRPQFFRDIFLPQLRNAHGLFHIGGHLGQKFIFRNPDGTHETWLSPDFYHDPAGRLQRRTE